MLIREAMSARGSGVNDTSSAILDCIGRVPVGRTAADVGSGWGRIANHLRSLGWDVQGCELDPTKAAAADVAVADVRNWEPDRLVDLVTCIELIEHVPREDQAGLLGRLRSWLPVGGTMVISSPQRHSPVAVWDRLEARRAGRVYDWWDPTHVAVLRRREMVALLGDQGFEVEAQTGVCFAPDALAVRLAFCRRLRYASTSGSLWRFGWNVIYTCRAVGR